MGRSTTTVLIDCKANETEKVVPYCEKVEEVEPVEETACIPVPETEERSHYCTETVLHHPNPVPKLAEEPEKQKEEEPEKCDCPCFKEVEIFDCGSESNHTTSADGDLVLTPLSYCAMPLYYDEYSECSSEEDEDEDEDETDHLDLALGAFMDALEDAVKASDDDHIVPPEDMFIDTMEMIDLPLL
mmetsp:Transcript_6513/g.11233  ORF Transcript_6513/g.11233 Transcript_6513/m.11233 type:complete len:186 (+) Transcript_6513:66-623(+)|eukprot:CAMPEP_0196661288 /NCGR_PEP_ID=MMETSP1086-20130531/43582_1 /TAXON_ID=77921 /ORGANISM="Cyanoptyche  gloeocystis , Strain SAG4.97" /LENGTH=185 /DNA_ID=CAMNT_0041996113 /DNA_START=66 /DNA_END=623 /DNA_ORIENTATION=+